MGKTDTHIFVSLPISYTDIQFSNELAEEVFLCLTMRDGSSGVLNHASALVENCL